MWELGELSKTPVVSQLLGLEQMRAWGIAGLLAAAWLTQHEEKQLAAKYLGQPHSGQEGTTEE